MPSWLFKFSLYCILAGHTKYKLNKVRHHTLSINYHNIKRTCSFAFWAEQWQTVRKYNFKDCLLICLYSRCQLCTCFLAFVFYLNSINMTNCWPEWGKNWTWWCYIIEEVILGQNPLKGSSAKIWDLKTWISSGSKEAKEIQRSLLIERQKQENPENTELGILHKFHTKWRKKGPQEFQSSRHRTW